MNCIVKFAEKFDMIKQCVLFRLDWGSFCLFCSFWNWF